MGMAYLSAGIFSTQRWLHGDVPESHSPWCSPPSAEAVPKKILDLMGVSGLTRENVASHLQASTMHHYAAMHCTVQYVKFLSGSCSAVCMHTPGGPECLAALSVSPFLECRTVAVQQSESWLMILGAVSAI